MHNSAYELPGIYKGKVRRIRLLLGSVSSVNREGRSEGKSSLCQKRSFIGYHPSTDTGVIGGIVSFVRLSHVVQGIDSDPELTVWIKATRRYGKQ